MLVRNRLDVLFEDEEFADLCPADGRLGFSPGSSRWCRCSSSPRFDYSLLSDFRARLVQGDAADRMVRVMLKRLTEAGLLKAGGRQRTDATYVLAAVRRLSRLEVAGGVCGPPLRNWP
ncbi:hypothetical protein [Streptomyces cylindrosporus]|uniref:Transposase n=1 Tax=Streptomyces cylindrosporus TaxID=2927583 RepID=A0ABS9Y8I7_9ACTN|nr:hypothetical protein [Streptomyces cylindrosporus]MCI3273549.1 hypothetical protein [Streptomyces cylindrosporus]